MAAGRPPLPVPARAGLALVALAGILLAATATGDIVALDTGFGQRRITGSSELVFVGVVVVGIALVALVRRETPTVLLAASLGAVGAGLGALIAVVAPTDDIFAGFPAPDYQSAGYMAIVAFLLGAAGSALVVATYAPRPAPRQGRHPAGPASVGVAVLSLIVPLLGVLAVGLGRLGLAAAGPGGDRNARAGVLLGWIVFGLWTAGGIVGIVLGLTGNLS